VSGCAEKELDWGFHQPLMELLRGLISRTGGDLGLARMRVYFYRAYAHNFDHMLTIEPAEPARTKSCKGKSGVAPMIDTRRCEGAGDCVSVCPFNVFEIRKLTPSEREVLPWVSRLKVLAHGGRQAFVVRPDACEACGLCVRACPEHAIRLSSTGVYA
jgi:4Fe-4S ferredoxin